MNYSKGNKKINFRNWGASLILLPIMILLVDNGGDFIFPDYVNLLIHEGGHGIFRIFGKFIYTLGGSFMQLAIPGMFVIFYFIKKQKLAAQLSLIWLGENFLNVGNYIADAVKMKLPLLGGNRVYHDWNYILNRINMLNYAGYIAIIVFVMGVCCFVVALLVPIFITKESRVEIELNL